MSDAVLIGKIINQEGKGVDHVVTREREREREREKKMTFSRNVGRTLMRRLIIPQRHANGRGGRVVLQNTQRADPNHCPDCGSVSREN